MRNQVRLILATVLALVLACNAAQAQPRIIDGDTIVLNGVHYRLYGIDAPETHQYCDETYPAGFYATQQLRDIVFMHTVTCDTGTLDVYGRTVAKCYADGKDLSRAMVESGYAFAYAKYSMDYVLLENEARHANRGIHKYNCMRPDAWRHGWSKRR